MASVCSIPSPPQHAMNRGVAMEDLASCLSALLGAGHSTTSYSATAGVIQITGFAARKAWQIAGLCLMVLGTFGKFAGALSFIPAPVIGGSVTVGLSILVGVALANLKYLDLKSSRNLMILGVSLLFGLIFPFWINDNPEAINTGAPEFDQVLVVFFSNGMFVGDITGFILDNIIPGARTERGLDTFLYGKVGTSSPHKHCTVYDLPYLPACCLRSSYCTYLPFMPTYDESRCCCCKKHKELI